LIFDLGGAWGTSIVAGLFANNKSRDEIYSKKNTAKTGIVAGLFAINQDLSSNKGSTAV